MSPQTIRRAAQRRIVKKAATAQQTGATAAEVNPQILELLSFGETFDTIISEISEAQLAANRANALLSPGPRSSIGKAVSALNALKTGLTGKTVLLPTDDANAYQRHVEHYFAELAPATGEERALVQCIADSDWRLSRIPGLKAGVYATSRRMIIDKFMDEPNTAHREAYLASQIESYRRELGNLDLQERRIGNRKAAATLELQALQNERLRNVGNGGEQLEIQRAA